MAKKKKNKNSQTFDVYPYLDQYQYLMRDGGALPWYQTRGPVRGGTAAGKPVRPNANDDAYQGKSQEFMKDLKQYYTDLAVWEEENNIPNDEREKDNVNRKPEEGKKKTIEEYLNEGFSQEEAQQMFESQGTTGQDAPLSVRAQGIQDYKDKKISKEQLDEILKTNPGEEEIVDNTLPPGETTEAQVVEETVVDGSGSGEGYELDEVEETTTGPTEAEKSEKEQAIQDYKDGKISRRELDELTQRYNTSGKRSDGYKTGNTQFETAPGSSWGLLANALQSTGKAVNNFGKLRINPKTGREYEKSDFQQSSLDWSNMSNENKANIYFDEENLRKFTGGDGDDLKVSDVFKTKTMNNADNFNIHQQENEDRATEAGHDNLYSRQTMDRVTGNTSYDDVTVDVENEISNPEYEAMVTILRTRGEEIDGHPELENIPKTITETESVTREHTDDDLTAGDKAMTNLKDMSTTEIIFDENGNPVQYKGFGGTGSGEGATGTWDYDPNKQYGDYEETITINEQERKNNRRKGLNDDGTVKVEVNEETPVNNVPDGATEVSRVTNEDFSVTITYDDGTEKTMNESPQAKRNREKKNRDNPSEGKIGLETFVYGGQPSEDKLSFTDIYAKGGDLLKWYAEGDETGTEVEDLLDVQEEVVAEYEDDSINFTEDEIALMDEETMGDTDLVTAETTYGEGTQNIKNRWGAATKTGIGGRIANTLGNVGQAAADIADFGNSVFDTWNNDAKAAKAENEGNDAESMFTVQESNQGIYDVNSGDGWTNKKVDEIYAGNTMKGPLIMQAGGPPAQQAPVEQELNYAALSQFSDNNAWDSEVSYSPEVIAYQKRIMGKMRDGGSLPTYQDVGEKVNQTLEYIPGFPRTGGAEFGPGGFNAEEYQNAITEDSTLLNNYINENPLRSYFAGSNQDHASSAGSWSGDIQLNREWKHKLLMQDDQEAAAKLNFYPTFRDGGGLLKAQDGWWDNIKDTASSAVNSVSDGLSSTASSFKKGYDNTSKYVNDKANKIDGNKLLDYTQTALTGAGLTPAYGIVADVVNTGISAGRAGYAAVTGDKEGTTKHLENTALNATSAIPGPAGWTAGGIGLSKDAAGYAGVIDDTSVTTQVADAITPTKEPVQIAENTKGVKIDKVARDGGEQEVEVDYETLQELIKAGADIEII